MEVCKIMKNDKTEKVNKKYVNKLKKHPQTSEGNSKFSSY